MGNRANIAVNSANDEPATEATTQYNHCCISSQGKNHWICHNGGSHVSITKQTIVQRTRDECLTRMRSTSTTASTAATTTAAAAAASTAAAATAGKVGHAHRKAASEPVAAGVVAGSTLPLVLLDSAILFAPLSTHIRAGGANTRCRLSCTV